ncbi:BamA/TamA family outer membrane protein [candidate division KSB3 bacterium]|uniref:BamA/TamA family outer membrane protein n=1 Tax=candidate division KSB3 bacterium TaxID=2044937 RepID=A0A9D5JW72_9BACT|nr:BamA/TamA family outer membrane protein [candidate division KSB3 bacterium]MBD3324836.1 BamA/TamA family outer membrane protein [candidate division KSB3 bacterium]
MRRRYTLQILILGIVLGLNMSLAAPAQQAQDAASGPSPQEVYPKVGLALSGGGARGFAHLGAIKVLEELGMPVDYIAGTSMGSIIGGLYAIGYSIEELEEVIQEVDWEDIFSDTPPRNLWSYQRKRASTRYILGVGFNRKGFVVPRGLTSGQKISNLLAFLTLRASDIEDFDNFPIPYRAVAADIVTGEEVILDHGSLADAMRASMSVPGVFTPITIDGHMLVDGGVVKNLPVDVVKQMGADVIIAIDVSSPLRDKESLGNPIAILNQMIGLQILRSTEEQRQLADVVVHVDLGEYSSTSFGNAPEISELGEQSTRDNLEKLRALLQDVRDTRPASRKVPSQVVKDVEDIYIEDIRIEGNTIYDEQILLKQLQEQEDAFLDPDRLAQEVTEIFSTGEYETVKFTLAQGEQADGRILKLQLEEHTQGPHQLRFGMNYESRFDDASEDKMVFLVNATLNNLIGKGSYWSTDLQFVNVDKIDTEYFQPLGKGFFVAPRLYSWDDYQLIYEAKESVARYDKNESGVGIRFGTFIRRIGEASLGYRLEYIDVEPSTAVEQERFPEFDEVVTSVFFQSRFDNLDTFPFPHSGTLLNIDYQWASTDFGGDIDFHKFLLEYEKYFSLTKRNTLGLRFKAGTDFKSDIRPYSAFLFGGQESFVGYKVEERTGSHLGVAAFEYRYQFYQLPSTVGGEISAILIGNVGNAWESFEQLSDEFTLRYGGSLGIGVDTILGPVRADFAMGDGGRQAVYLNIGYRF